jgi:uncharacterized protein YecE (DUF72 family)
MGRQEDLQAHIDKVVAQFPPLGPEQRAELASLLSMGHVHHFVPVRRGTWHGQPSFELVCECGVQQGDEG